MSNVHQLHAIHPERREQVQAFCANQAGHFMRLASRPDGAVAALSVVITGDDQIETKLAAMEPEHAMVMLEELDRLRVKLTAYDYSIFGSMQGEVTQIGADAVPSEDKSQPNAFFFIARVETKTSGFETFGRQLPVIPGMQAQVDIVTGEKTVLSYLSKPLIGVKEGTG